MTAYQARQPFTPDMHLPEGTIIITRDLRCYKVGDKRGFRAKYRCAYGSFIYPYYAEAEDLREGVAVWGRKGDNIQPAKSIQYVELPAVAAEPIKPQGVTMSNDNAFQVGDTVYSVRFGRCNVVGISTDPAATYPVAVGMGSSGKTSATFTRDGREYTDDLLPSLFFAPVRIDATHTTRPVKTFRPGNVVLNRLSGAVAVVSHDRAVDSFTHLYTAGGTSGPVYTAYRTDLKLIAESVNKE